MNTDLNDKINSNKLIQDEINNPNKLIQDEISKILKCAICHRVLYKPVSLLCQHNFCKKCINSIIEKKCPTCRVKFVEPIQYNRELDAIFKLILSKKYSKRVINEQKDKLKINLHDQVLNELKNDLYNQCVDFAITQYNIILPRQTQSLTNTNHTLNNVNTNQTDVNTNQTDVNTSQIQTDVNTSQTRPILQLPNTINENTRIFNNVRIQILNNNLNINNPRNTYEYMINIFNEGFIMDKNILIAYLINPVFYIQIIKRFIFVLIFLLILSITWRYSNLDIIYIPIICIIGIINIGLYLSIYFYEAIIDKLKLVITVN